MLQKNDLLALKFGINVVVVIIYLYQAQELNKQRETDRTIVVSVENLRFFFEFFFTVFDVQSDKLHRFCF